MDSLRSVAPGCGNVQGLIPPPPPMDHLNVPPRADGIARRERSVERREYTEEMREWARNGRERAERADDVGRARHFLAFANMEAVAGEWARADGGMNAVAPQPELVPAPAADPPAPVAEVLAQPPSAAVLEGRAAAIASLKNIIPNFPNEVYAEEVERAEGGVNVVPAYPVELVINNAMDGLLGRPQPQPPQPQANAQRLPKAPKLSVEEIVNRVKEMFPRVDPTWIAEQAGKLRNLDAVVDHMTNRAVNVPKIERGQKRKGPEATAVVEAKKEKVATGPVNYFTRPVMYRDRQVWAQTETVLRDKFPRVGVASIQQVLSVFGGNYAPSYKAIHDTVEEHPNFKKNYVGGNIAASKPLGPTNANYTFNAVTHIRILQNKRNRLAMRPENMQAELRAEVEWVAEAMKNGVPEPEPPSPSPQSSPSEPLMECEICCDEKAADLFAACRDGHAFCRECLGRQATEAVYGQGAAEMRCPESGCTVGFAMDVLGSFLSADQATKLAERSGAQAVAAAQLSNFVTCKYCSWGAVVEVPASVDKVFRCGECEGEFCRLCERDWEEHVGLRCEELESDAATTARRKREEAASSAVLRTCHKCGLQFQKIEGCNKMTCTCKATSCYLCKVPDIDYNHFCRHPLDPGTACTKCRKCMLWEKPDRIDNARLKAVEDAIAKGEI